ncbi:sulfatase family protein [Maribellus maritimus]|uniref:sulfatase family protein n=1 Tax=Maribellus maritimus TaxID=2870838 RepID=UPI001EEA1220|nr:sulfatase-like hydrolase/transferase [Maribellus maritimus]MCG6186027.1 sulfatase-like hydrolase/transferase [Maribellus maritimus]
MKIKTAIKITLSLVLITLLLQRAYSQAVQKPNIVVIMTDQQFADAMSCVMGEQYIHTPNMDKLAEKGIRFTHAYSPNPLCMPMRTSMMTGRFPHETGVLTNDDEDISPSDFVFLGKLFKDAGYETGYFGKWHVAFDEKQKKIHGFDNPIAKGSQLDAEPAATFLKQKHEKPFLVVASFLSPHEVCQWSRKQNLPGGPISEMPQLEDLPPLKTNFFPPENETDIMAFMRKSYQANLRLFPVGDYTDADWRRLQWGYYRLIERADAFVGTVMDALKESGQEKNTLVVFLSDHGDCAGSHHWNQKTVFYDESARVPFIMKWDGKTIKGTSDVLLNTGTDMIPTLCDFAGIEIPKGLPGKSLKATATGKAPEWKREYVVTENHMVQCEPVDGRNYKPQGRMVRSSRYKYCIYSEGNDRESLGDMDSDPLEMVNQAANPVYKKILEQHRKYLKEHANQTNDAMALKMLNDLNN